MTPLYIFDLDQTLSDMSHRLDLLGEWDIFYQACIDDDPIIQTIKLMDQLISHGSDVWVWTGRNESVRGLTEDWLERHTMLRSFDRTLKMRPMDNRQNDDILKRDWLNQLGETDRKRLVCVFDDRNRVVRMWRKQGVTCMQVADGNY